MSSNFTNTSLLILGIVIFIIAIVLAAKSKISFVVVLILAMIGGGLVGYNAASLRQRNVI